MLLALQTYLFLLQVMVSERSYLLLVLKRSRRHMTIMSSVKMAATPSEMYSQRCSISSVSGTWYICIEQVSHIFTTACCQCYVVSPHLILSMLHTIYLAQNWYLGRCVKETFPAINQWLKLHMTINFQKFGKGLELVFPVCLNSLKPYLQIDFFQTSFCILIPHFFKTFSVQLIIISSHIDWHGEVYFCAGFPVRPCSRALSNQLDSHII